MSGGKSALVLLALSACNQQRLDSADILCRDGVEYLAMGVGSGRTIVPHMKANGGVYTC